MAGYPFRNNRTNNRNKQQKQTTETNNRNNASSPKTITAANNEENYKLTRAKYSFMRE